MSEVQFEEEQQLQRAYVAPQKSLFVRLVLATRIVSTDQAATYVLTGIAAAAILLAFAVQIFANGSHGSVPKNVIYSVTPPNTSGFR